MRQGHLVLIFLIIYISCFMLLCVSREKYDIVQKEKQKVEQALSDALESAGREFEGVINASENKKKQTLETAFFESFYVSMGVFDNQEMQEQLRMYLPMLVLAEADGVYFHYMQEQQKDGMVVFSPVWSDKIDYGFNESDTETQKKSIVAETLEKYSSEIITNHNYIASQCGIAYLFYVPDFLQNTTTKLEFPMLFVVFQGWPLVAAGDVVYENCVDAGLYIREVERYLITGGESISQTFCLYHKEKCLSIDGGQKQFVAEYVTEEEAVRKYGALPCEQCIP